MKDVRMTIMRDAVLGMVRNVAWVSADALPDADGHRRHTLTDLCEAGNLARVEQVLELGVMECLSALGSWARESLGSGSCVATGGGGGDCCWEFRLRVPDDVGDVTVRLVRALVDEYLVARVLWDWCCLVHLTDAAALWALRMDSAMERVRSAVLSGGDSGYRRMSVF